MMMGHLVVVGMVVVVRWAVPQVMDISCLKFKKMDGVKRVWGSSFSWYASGTYQLHNLVRIWSCSVCVWYQFWQLNKQWCGTEFWQFAWCDLNPSASGPYQFCHGVWSPTNFTSNSSLKQVTALIPSCHESYGFGQWHGPFRVLSTLM